MGSLPEANNQFLYSNRLGKTEIRNAEEAIFASRERMDYAISIRPKIDEAIEKLGMDKYVGWVEITGSAVAGASQKDSDLDFVIVLKGGAKLFAHNVSGVQIHQKVEELLGGKLKYPTHFFVEAFEDFTRKSSQRMSQEN